jgi:hypothetical protein
MVQRNVIVFCNETRLQNNLQNNASSGKSYELFSSATTHLPEIRMNFIQAKQRIFRKVI